MSVLSEVGDKILAQLSVKEMLEAEDAFYEGHEPTHEELHQLEPNFIEWLYFDYRLDPTALNLIERYLKKYGDNHSLDTRLRLQDMVSTQRYGIWRVDDVAPGQSIALYDAKTGQTIQVRERLGSRQLKTNQLIICRVSKQGNHWEITSGVIYPLPVSMPDNILEQLAATNGTATPRDQIGLLLKSHRDKPTLNDKPVPLEQARRAMESALENYGLSDHLSVDAVENLIRLDHQPGSAEPDDSKVRLTLPYTMIMGLFSEPPEDGQDLLAALNDLNFALFPKKLKKLKKYGPELHMIELDLMSWTEHANEGQQLMHQGKYEESAKEYEAALAALHEVRSTSSEVYRLYGNLATCYFATGDLPLGERMLEIALELNPNYDFALRQLERLESGELADMSFAATLKKLAEKPADSLIPGGQWDPQEIERAWDDGQILSELAALGVKTSPELFKKQAKRFISSDDFAHKVWDRLVPDPENQEFLWIAAGALWDRWLPDRPAVETFIRFGYLIDDTLYPEDGSKPAQKQLLKLANKLTETIGQADKKTIKQLLKNYGYMEARLSFIYLATRLLNETPKPCQETAVQLAKQLERKTGDTLYRAVTLAAKLTVKNIEEVAEETQQAFGAEHHGWLVMSDLERISPKIRAKILERGLASIQARDKNNQTTKLAYCRCSLFTAYTELLDELIGIYEGLGKQKDINRIEALLKQIEGRREELNHQPDEALLQQGFEKMVDALLADHPSYNYYQWLKPLGINFATPELTESNITILPPEGAKTGRNDPCPCGKSKPDGTPIKYKKCHAAA